MFLSTCNNICQSFFRRQENETSLCVSVDFDISENFQGINIDVTRVKIKTPSASSIKDDQKLFWNKTWQNWKYWEGIL